MREIRGKNSVIENGSARDAILSSIRSSLAASAPFDAEHRKHHSGTENSLSSPLSEFSRGSLIDNFEKNLESVGGHCVVVSDTSKTSDSVRAIVGNIGAKRIAISDSALVSIVVGNSGVECVKNAPADVLFECDIGITSAQWAIAETGTLVLESDVESHRLASLVPPVHLCLIKASIIRQTLGEILELTSQQLSRTITFITGASRTSDIELTLAIGVHGPGELHVIVIANE